MKFKCCVGGCDATSDTHRLFSVPKNDSLRKLWLFFLVPTNPLLIGLSQEQLIRKRVCEKHFEKQQFHNKKILRDSYPTLLTESEIKHGEPLSKDRPGQGDHTYSKDPETVDDIEDDNNYCDEELVVLGNSDVSASVLETDSTEKEKNIVARLTLTKAQKSDLRKAFNLLDFAGEGKIKAEDFRVAIKALGYEPTKEELLSMINAVDKGKTGALSYENFETAIMRKIMSLDSDDNIMKSFHLFDTDNTGFISFENLKKVTEILGINLTDEEIEEMIEDADKDFDGFISEQEFKKMIKNAVHIATP